MKTFQEYLEEGRVDEIKKFIDSLTNVTDLIVKNNSELENYFKDKEYKDLTISIAKFLATVNKRI